MSFICGICYCYTKPREKATRVVTDTRDKIYPYREDAHVFVQDNHKEVRDDPGGRGWEIATEVLACQTCAKGTNPEETHNES